MHTADIYNKQTSSQKVGTQEFAEEVIKRLGNKPSKLKIANYSNAPSTQKAFDYKIDNSEKKILVGVDIYIDMHVNSADKIAAKINPIDSGKLILKTIACKGLKLWPHADEYLIDSDHWCCRFMPKSGAINHTDIHKLLAELAAINIDFIKVENLYEFDGKRGYSLAQGE